MKIGDTYERDLKDHKKSRGCIFVLNAAFRWATQAESKVVETNTMTSIIKRAKGIK
jgi:hypothetical protein